MTSWTEEIKIINDGVFKRVGDIQADIVESWKKKWIDHVIRVKGFREWGQRKRFQEMDRIP